jgi:hypothetical protein
MSYTQTNNNWPSGFRPVMVDTAGAPVGVREYAKPASDSSAIFTYDLVTKAAVSQTVEGQTIPTPGIKTFSEGTPGTTLILGSSLNYGAPSTISYHTVIDDPTAIFAAQCDGTTSITVASAVGKNANVNNTAQTNGLLQSAMQVSSSSIATTAGLDLRIQDLGRALTNVEGANAIVEVIILKHQFAYGSAGV